MGSAGDVENIKEMKMTTLESKKQSEQSIHERPTKLERPNAQIDPLSATQTQPVSPTQARFLQETVMGSQRRSRETGNEPLWTRKPEARDSESAKWVVLMQMGYLKGFNGFFVAIKGE